MSTRDNSSFYDRRMDRLGHKRVIAVFIIFFAIFPKITNKILLFLSISLPKFLGRLQKEGKRTGEAQLQRKIKFCAENKMDKQRLFCG